MAMNPTFPNWVGQRVWIIGASTGIGAACATQLLRAGAKVAVSARRAELLAALIAAANPRPAPGATAINAPSATSQATLQAINLPLDILDLAALRAARQTIVDHWGGLDLVIVMAGDYTPMPIDQFNLAQAERLLDVNLRGPLRVLDAVLPQLLAQGQGTLALVASVAGYTGLPKALAYGPTKAALINLAETLYLELKPRGLGVAVVNPGFVATPLTAGNDFRMPALISADDAATQTLAGLAAGAFEVHYPKRFTRTLKFLQLLPYRWRMPLIARTTGA